MRALSGGDRGWAELIKLYHIDHQDGHDEYVPKHTKTGFVAVAELAYHVDNSSTDNLLNLNPIIVFKTHALLYKISKPGNLYRFYSFAYNAAKATWEPRGRFPRFGAAVCRHMVP